MPNITIFLFGVAFILFAIAGLIMHKRVKLVRTITSNLIEDKNDLLDRFNDLRKELMIIKKPSKYEIGEMDNTSLIIVAIYPYIEGPIRDIKQDVYYQYSVYDKDTKITKVYLESEIDNIINLKSTDK